MEKYSFTHVSSHEFIWTMINECGIDYDVAKRILEDCLDVWDLNDIGRFGGSLPLEYPVPDSNYYDTIGVVMDKYLPNETTVYLDCD